MFRLLLTTTTALSELTTAFSQSVTVFTRRRQGMRSYSVGQLVALSATALSIPHLLTFAHALLLYFMPILMFVPMPGLDIAVSPFFTVYLLAVPVMAIWRQAHERARLRRGDALHSHCRGLSPLECLARLSPRITLSHVYCYLEPAAVFLTGALAYRFISAALGGW